MSDQKIKAVLFDLGETLLNFGKINTSRLFRQGAKSSYSFLKQQKQPVGSYYKYFWRNLFHLKTSNVISNITGNDFDSLALLRNIGTKKGIQMNTQQWQELAWLWYKPLCEIAKIEPEITETLSALKKMGLKLGILSNTFVNRASLERHLDHLGILDFFTVRLYSYEFDFRKPDMRIFKIAAEKIGELFENILFVGDSLNNDIKPALTSGMSAALKSAYTNRKKKVPSGVYRIKSVSELPALIKKINTNNQLAATRI